MSVPLLDPWWDAKWEQNLSEQHYLRETVMPYNHEQAIASLYMTVSMRKPDY